MRAAALVVSLALSVTACFPTNARHRTYAKIGEGASIAGGIAMLSFVKTGADCDMNPTPGLPADDCRGDANLIGTVGLGLILLGLAGFIATVSTSPDDDASSVSPPAIAAPAPAPAR